MGTAPAVHGSGPCDGAIVASALCCAGVLALWLRARSRLAADARRIAERDGHRRSEVRALLAASRRSSGSVLATLARHLRDAGADGVLVFIPAGDDLACAYAAGDRMLHCASLVLRRDGPSLVAAADRARCRATAPGIHPMLLPTDRWAVAVPMLDGDGVAGVVYAASLAVPGREAADTVAGAVEFAGIPYAIAREREADRSDATYDGLTGLLTPRAFRRRLRDACSVVRPDRTLSLWFVDTDAFKRINDEFGHRAGDRVLQAMAALLREHLVEGIDLAARNGGDEFCAMLQAGKAGAILRARAFCSAVRAYDFGVSVRVTASVGVATFPYDAGAWRELLERADAAMYHAKRSGRDGVAFAGDSGFVRATL